MPLYRYYVDDGNFVFGYLFVVGCVSIRIYAVGEFNTKKYLLVTIFPAVFYRTDGQFMGRQCRGDGYVVQGWITEISRNQRSS